MFSECSDEGEQLGLEMEGPPLSSAGGTGPDAEPRSGSARSWTSFGRLGTTLYPARSADLPQPHTKAG